MNRVRIVALTLTTLLVVGAAARADEAPQQPALSQPAVPADNAAQQIEPAGGCMPGGGCCGSGACAHAAGAQDPATAAPADTATGGCPCMKGKHPKKPM